MAAHEDDVEEEEEIKSGAARSCIGWVGSLMVSSVGGLMLIGWELKYQPTNRQQWMVPLGLILFLTPLLICFSVAVSDFCPGPTHTKTCLYVDTNTDLETGHPSSWSL